MDKFNINYVKFSWPEKSMNFSLTFNGLSANGSYAGIGNLINYVPISGRGNYEFKIRSKFEKTGLFFFGKTSWN
jgi:hypothetical protein